MHELFDLPNLIGTYGYAGILIIVFLESGIFFPLPGDSLLFTAGLLAPTLGYNVIILAALVFVAAFFGGLVGYYIGTKLDFVYQHPFLKKIFKKEYLDKAHDFLEKYGLPALILCRFVPIVRTFLPIVAGMVRMNKVDFFNYSMIGSLVWSASFIFGGYFLGKAFPQIQNYLLYIVVIIVLISIVPGLMHFLKSKKKEIIEHAKK